MKRKLEGSVVVLTGASSGVGRAAALLFASRGAKLVLAARDSDPLEEVARECRSRFGVEAIAVPTDVRDEGDVIALAERAVERFERIDVWVNDAAVYMLGPLEFVPTFAFHDVIDTNLMGTVHGARAAIEQFRRQGSGGVVVNMGSVAGKVAYAQASAYCASKHAIHAVNEALRQELAGSDIHACLVVAATIDTPFFQHAANYTGREVRAMRPVYPARRVAEAIVRVAERPRREVVVGLAPRLMTLFGRLLPRLYARAQRAWVLRDHLGPSGAHADSGNLDEPRPPFAVEGGWRGRARRQLPARSPAQAR